MELAGSWLVKAGTSIAATSTTVQLVALAHRGLCVARVLQLLRQLMAQLLGLQHLAVVLVAVQA